MIIETGNIYEAEYIATFTTAREIDPDWRRVGNSWHKTFLFEDEDGSGREAQLYWRDNYIVWQRNLKARLDTLSNELRQRQSVRQKPE